jgi:hypothetical protein
VEKAEIKPVSCKKLLMLLYKLYSLKELKLYDNENNVPDRNAISGAHKRDLVVSKVIMIQSTGKNICTNATWV